MRSRRSLKLSHTQTSVPCGTLNDHEFNTSLVEEVIVYKNLIQALQI